jgi:hypothetical protein
MIENAPRIVIVLIYSFILDKNGDVIWKRGGVEELIKHFPSLSEEEQYNEQQRMESDSLKIETLFALSNIALSGNQRT